MLQVSCMLFYDQKMANFVTDISRARPLPSQDGVPHHQIRHQNHYLPGDDFRPRRYPLWVTPDDQLFPNTHHHHLPPPIFSPLDMVEPLALQPRQSTPSLLHPRRLHQQALARPTLWSPLSKRSTLPASVLDTSRLYPHSLPRRSRRKRHLDGLDVDI
jgi:hypothetical protein